jgi:glucosamine-6-phosphate deaminase
MNTQIYKTRAAMGAAAAQQVSGRIAELLTTQDTVNMIFAAAPSQNEFLAALLEAPVEWSRVRGFHMDEYLGLPADAPQGFGNFLRQRLFGKAPFLSVEYLNGNTADPQSECTRYSQLLQRYPPDIVCMGIGENGHIAFNDPPVADFADPLLVKIVELDGPCRQQQVNDGCFASLPEVPTHAITLTVPALMTGRYVYCMVPGKLKAPAVYNTIKQEIAEPYPSTILRRHGQTELFLDEDSASKLSQ